MSQIWLAECRGCGTGDNPVWREHCEESADDPEDDVVATDVRVVLACCDCGTTRVLE